MKNKIKENKNNKNTKVGISPKARPKSEIMYLIFKRK